MTNKNEARAEAERIVDRYLTMIMASDNDAGWQGSGVIGRLVDFKGELPKSSGFSGFSKVWEQAQLMGSWPPRFKVAARMMWAMGPRQREALCADRAFRGRIKVGNDANQVLWDDRRCADALGCTVKVFQTRVKDGYCRLETMAGGHIQQHAA